MPTMPAVASFKLFVYAHRIADCDLSKIDEPQTVIRVGQSGVQHGFEKKPAFPIERNRSNFGLEGLEESSTILWCTVLCLSNACIDTVQDSLNECPISLLYWGTLPLAGISFSFSNGVPV